MDSRIIVATMSDELHDAAPVLEYDDSAPLLWMSVVELGESLPAEVWDQVPTDLAAHLDHYLYASSREGE